MTIRSVTRPSRQLKIWDSPYVPTTWALGGAAQCWVGVKLVGQPTCSHHLGVGWESRVIAINGWGEEVGVWGRGDETDGYYYGKWRLVLTLVHTHTHTRTHPFRIANLNQREVRHLHIDCCMDGFWIVQDIGSTTQGQNNHVIWDLAFENCILMFSYKNCTIWRNACCFLERFAFCVQMFQFFLQELYY